MVIHAQEAWSACPLAGLGLATPVGSVIHLHSRAYKKARSKK